MGDTRQCLRKERIAKAKIFCRSFLYWIFCLYKKKIDSKNNPETYFFFHIYYFFYLTINRFYQVYIQSFRIKISYMCINCSTLLMGTNRCTLSLKQIFELMEINSIESKYLSNINFSPIPQPIHHA